MSDCKIICPVCGSGPLEIPATLIVDRGIVVANGKFTVLTGKEASVLSLLIETFPRFASRQAIMNDLYFDKPDDEPDPKIVDVFVCKLRSKLKSLDVQIETSWGEGYGLSPTSRLSITCAEDDAERLAS